MNNYLDRGNKDYVLWYYVGKAVAQGQGCIPMDGAGLPVHVPAVGRGDAGDRQPGRPPGVHPPAGGGQLGGVGGGVPAVGPAGPRGASGGGGGKRWLYLVPSLGVIAYIHDTYLLGQPNLLLLACMLGAFACLKAGWSIPAGALIAFAAAVKAFPLMAVGYLVYRRMWKATASPGGRLDADDDRPADAVPGDRGGL